MLTTLVAKIDAVTGETLYAKPRADRKRPARKAKMEYRGLTFHDLRRSAAVRNLVRGQVPERIAMQISGHKTRAVFDRYNIVSENDIMDAGRKLSEFHNGQPKNGDNSGTILHHDAAVDSTIN